MKKSPTVKVKVTPLKEDEEKKAAKAAVKTEKAAKAAGKTPAKKEAAPKTGQAVKTKPERPAPKAEKTEKHGGYTFELRASNGEKMLSGGYYTTLAGAKGGIETYKNNIKKGNFRIVQTKMGDYIFQLLNANGKLLAYGADYNTRAGCESARDSTRRFAATAPVEVSEQ